jgi:hypothetical protein
MNSNRPSKSEVRKQAKAARRFAGKQPTKRVSPDTWRLVCPKGAR